MPRVGDPYDPLRLYVRSRRVWMSFALTAALCAILPVAGAFLIPMPSESADGGVALVPAWRVLAVGVTFGPVLFCHSPFGEMETATGRNWRRTEMVVLIVNSLVCTTMFTATCLIVFGGDLAMLVLRGIIGWMGIALLTGKLLGWRMAWVGPFAVLPILIFWGYQYPAYRWWEFTARPIGDLVAWAVVAALAGLGTVAYVCNSWRWYAVLTLLGRRSTAGRGARRA